MVDLVSHCCGDSCNELFIFKMKSKLGDYRKFATVQTEAAGIEYTRPIGLGGNRRNEVLSMAQIGSPAHSMQRTFKITGSPGNSRRGKPCIPISV